MTAAARRLLAGGAALSSVDKLGGRRLVALTYDDGPNPHNTLPLVELLDEHGAKATFFVIGQKIEGREDILLQTANAGHEIGNHTFSHVRTHRPTVESIQSDIARSQELVENVTGVRSSLVRPPFGRAVRLYARAAENLGMQAVLWSVDPRDWEEGTNARAVTERALARVRPGSIVLLHDGGTFRPSVLGATDELIRRLRADGYEFVTVSRLIAAGARAPSIGFCQSVVM
jgi:peptidoglycan/xylan/chitin deacetylase (PgdA/CDA1 family)